ncbi:formate dehydrogenase [Aquibaculum arenosum]|uniref:Formate dehydrogenase n=1 Tax=Aquibaculum arenosum TaxID=3032591 RepID=A0ABT5YNU1_9PROT|nr:formate dehydrogenase [Fodinicurvata sp. CAU 1616]MDF2096547.1 formate dehydrogenase [Fodinicurvata sp. CAU 1616]
MKDEKVTSTARRDFFRKAGLGVGALGAAAVTMAAGGEAEAAEERKPKGYQESAHVKRYYELARF